MQNITPHNKENMISEIGMARLINTSPKLDSMYVDITIQQ